MQGVNSQLQQLWESQAIPPHRVILAGFSQGAALALFCALNLPYTVAGVLSLSGWLEFAAEYPINFLEWGSKREMSMMFMHGKQDKIAPVFLHSHATELLTTAGFKVDSWLFNMEHTFMQEQGVHIRRWLLNVLPRMRSGSSDLSHAGPSQLHHQQHLLTQVLNHSQTGSTGRAASAAQATYSSSHSSAVHGGKEWVRTASAAAMGSKRGRVDSQDGYAALALVRIPSAGKTPALIAGGAGDRERTSLKPPELPKAFKLSQGMWVSQSHGDLAVTIGAGSRGSTAELWGLNNLGSPDPTRNLLFKAISGDEAYKYPHLPVRNTVSAASTYSGHALSLGSSTASPSARSPLAQAAASSMQGSSRTHNQRSPGISGVHTPKYGRERDARALLGTAGSFSSLQIEAAGGGSQQARDQGGRAAAGSTLAWPMPKCKRRSGTALRKENSHWAMAGRHNGPSDAGLVHGCRAATPGTLHNQQMMAQWGITADLMPGASCGSYMTGTPAGGGAPGQAIAPGTASLSTGGT